MSERIRDAEGGARGPMRAGVIPAYQAARWIHGVVERTRERIATVVVVDDGSTDGTGDLARSAGARVLTHERNLGKGWALRTAFLELLGEGFDEFVTLDADGQHLPEQIPRLVHALRATSADLVVGTRDHLFAGMSPVRRASNRLSTRAISILAGARQSDIQSGFRLYTQRLLEGTGLPKGRFEAESSIIVKAVRRGFRVVGTPVELGYTDGRHSSHYRPIRDSLRIALAVVGARLEGNRG